jgi:hypothetical protein
MRLAFKWNKLIKCSYYRQSSHGGARASIYWLKRLYWLDQQFDCWNLIAFMVIWKITKIIFLSFRTQPMELKDLCPKFTWTTHSISLVEMPKLKITLYFEQSNFLIQLLDCKLSQKAVTKWTTRKEEIYRFWRFAYLYGFQIYLTSSS